MAYALQRTTEPESLSDLESVTESLPESPHQGRFHFASLKRLLAGAALLGAGTLLVVTALGKSDRMAKARTGATLGLSQNDEMWQQILGDDAFKKMKSDEAELSQIQAQQDEALDWIAGSTTTTNLRAASSELPAATTSLMGSLDSPRSSMGSASDMSSQNLSALAEEFRAEAQHHKTGSPQHKSMSSVAKLIGDAATQLGRQPAASDPVPSLGLKQNPLAPNEALHDGNKCPADEEEYPQTGGTCYKKCADLTGGTYPVRSSAFSCCKAEPCGIGNSMIHLSFCGGFDVAGDAEGKGCPSGEGACLKDEELLAGICYKKCSSFEGGDIYNHRVAPNICCRTKGFRCLLPTYFRLRTEFATGGGAGDGTPDTPSQPHPPIQSLTEVTA